MFDNIKAVKKSEPGKVLDIPFSYPEAVIPIINPVLKCFYAYGPELIQKMNKISSYAFELNFLSYDCRQTIFDTALDEYKINLGQGPLPEYIIFALSTIDRSRGNDHMSLTHFEQLDMVEFDLMLSELISIYEFVYK